MSQEVRNLEPSIMWSRFADLNEVPRPSKKEERVIAFMKKFGEDLGFPTIVDEVGNVIIKKPATDGMEDRQTVILQSHLDMVHQKNNDTDFDFDSEGIRMYVDGDWVRAEGTTLGADNGIGVASIMALLASNDIPHPALEALLTIDEETGMTGAMGLKGGLLDGQILLNLDTEDDDEITIGCAGGIDVTATGRFLSQEADDTRSWFKITLNGLSGGHSGMDIHRGRGNANKLMNRALAHINDRVDLQISTIDGGGLRNAIPRESVAVIGVHNEESLNEEVKVLDTIFKDEFRSTDPNIQLVTESVELPSKAMTNDFAGNFIRAVAACPLGIWRMSPEIDGLVQTSNNIARVLVEDGNYTVQCLTRSSVDTEKMEEAEAIKGLFELIGGSVEFGGSYPGWTPRPDAGIVSVMSNLYKEMFNSDAHVNACHAGLECGILGTNYPEVEMISFGPNIRGAHSPDECVQISSVQKYWGLLLETLVRIPKV